jgi:lysine-specific permease
VRYEDMEIAPWVAANRGAQTQRVANREPAG